MLRQVWNLCCLGSNACTGYAMLSFFFPIQVCSAIPVNGSCAHLRTKWHQGSSLQSLTLSSCIPLNSGSLLVVSHDEVGMRHVALYCVATSFAWDSWWHGSEAIPSAPGFPNGPYKWFLMILCNSSFQVSIKQQLYQQIPPFLPWLCLMRYDCKALAS